MNPEAQRIAIAEACALRIKLDVPTWPQFFNEQTRKWKLLPSYLSDLNAMQEAEKVGLNASERRGSFICHLQMICGASGAYFATATQRAEAFLRTLNLWIETK